MFSSAERGAKLSKAEYKAAEPQLRVDLINAQYDLARAPFAAIVLIAGDDRVACEEAVDLLHDWVDARYIATTVFTRPTDEERERPRFWRYWRALPRRGRIGLHLGAYPLNAIAERLSGELDDAKFEKRIGHARRFERALVDDGALIIKIWLHLPRKELRKRLKRAKKEPGESWWVEETDWQVYKHYDRAMPVAEQFLKGTDTEDAPWRVIESTDTEYRNLKVAQTLRDALVGRLSAPPSQRAAPAERAPHGDLLAAVDLSARLEPDEYKESLAKLQRRLHKRTGSAERKGRSGVFVFEGWDAAGKGGIIRRMTRAMPARRYSVIPIGAPTEDELAHHYLWRFWRRLPAAGRMTIFDRSWYGRVLVERVEGFARPDEWARGFDEINDFEAQLVERGIVVRKFWLHIDPDEQLRRFQARERTPYKKYKLTEEDYRNRDRWDDYVAAVNEMVARTSTKAAPWTLVASNDKRAARIQVLDEVCRAYK